MIENFKRFWDWMTTIFVSIVAIIAILVVGARFFGLEVYTILSGSMEPEFPVGSIIYVKDVDAHDLEEGDVITFMMNANTVATHRIVEVIEEEGDLQFKTKGDANDAVDGGLVHYRNIIGTPVLTIPLLGYLINYIQSPPGIYIAMIISAILIAFAFLPDLFFKKKDKQI